MLAPDKVLLKRKRTEDPPNALLLARSDANSTPTKRIRYVLQSGEVTTGASTSSAQHKVLPRTRQARRRFQLRRAPAAKHDEVQDKRSHNDADDLPTFEAESRTIARQTRFDDVDMSDASSDAAPPIKRPGRGSALRSTTATTRRRSPDDGTGMAALAESMHEFALQELAKIPKSTRTSKPRMSPEQSKARHDRNMARQVFNDASKAEMMDMDDKDFVYDTYVLAVADHMDTSPDENVGYLVIKEDDEEYWQTFLQQNEDEPDEEPDEEDENGEWHHLAQVVRH